MVPWTTPRRALSEKAADNQKVIKDSLRTFLITAALMPAVVFATSVSAKSREKRCQVISTCSLLGPVTCATSTSQPEAPTQTCCQPAAASVQPQIELVAYTRPAAPRRLAPQPDALEINPTIAQTTCAQFMIHGRYQTEETGSRERHSTYSRTELR